MEFTSVNATFLEQKQETKYYCGTGTSVRVTRLRKKCKNRTLLLTTYFLLQQKKKKGGNLFFAVSIKLQFVLKCSAESNDWLQSILSVQCILFLIISFYTSIQRWKYENVIGILKITGLKKIKETKPKIYYHREASFINFQLKIEDQTPSKLFCKNYFYNYKSTYSDTWRIFSFPSSTEMLTLSFTCSTASKAPKNSMKRFPFRDTNI